MSEQTIQRLARLIALTRDLHRGLIAEMSLCLSLDNQEPTNQPTARIVPFAKGRAHPHPTRVGKSRVVETETEGDKVDLTNGITDDDRHRAEKEAREWVEGLRGEVERREMVVGGERRVVEEEWIGDQGKKSLWVDDGN